MIRGDLETVFVVQFDGDGDIFEQREARGGKFGDGFRETASHGQI